MQVKYRDSIEIRGRDFFIIVAEVITVSLLFYRNGSWILLSNLQLALNWLPRLESLLRSPMCTTSKNPSTRIWLTTEECSGFYPGLSALCLKLAYEPPEGVKRNMKKSLQQLRQVQTNNDGAVAVMVLSWLHATLQERRNFVPQGWIRSYEWNDSDLEAAYELVIKETSKEKQSQKGMNLYFFLVLNFISDSLTYDLI